MTKSASVMICEALGLNPAKVEKIIIVADRDKVSVETHCLETHGEAVADILSKFTLMPDAGEMKP